MVDDRLNNMTFSLVGFGVQTFDRGLYIYPPLPLRNKSKENPNEKKFPKERKVKTKVNLALR